MADAPSVVASATDPLTVSFVTRDEALVVHDGSTNLLSSALRMFISRMEDPYRLAAYAALVTDASQFALWGDLPSPEALDWFTQYTARSGATSLSLRRREVTGTMREIDGRYVGVGRLAEGEVMEVRTVVGASETAPWYIASGHTAHPNLRALDPFDKPESFVSGTTGVASTREIARVKAQAEAVERFVSGDLSTRQLVRLPARKIAGEWLDPRTVILYSPRQVSSLGLRPFDPDQPDWWVLGTRGGRACHIPAALVFSPFPSTPGWLHWSATSSNGVAAHETLPQATLSAWLELVERDAFQRSRLSGGRNGTERLDPESLPADVHTILSIAQGLGAVTLLRMPSPTGVPVCLARIDRDDGVALGMAAAARDALASVKALTEAVAQAVAPFNHEVSLEDVRGPGDHSAYHAPLHRRRRLDWMLTAPVAVASNTPTPACVLPDHAVVFEFQNETAFPISVARVLDPRLIPLTFGYDTDPLGRDDVRGLAMLGGWDGASPIDPHPFA